MKAKPWWWVMALVLLTATAAPMLGQAQFAGAEFRVNGDTNAILHNPAVAFSANGNAIVVWQDEQAGLRGRFYSNNGNALGNELALVYNQNLQR